MSLNEKLIGEIMAALAEAIQNGDNKTIRKVHALLFSHQQDLTKTSSKRNNVRAQKPIIPNTKLENLRLEIESFESREALSAFLRTEFDTKVKIFTVSRALKVQTNSSDAYEGIIEKIIDATVGYKLRSRAIRGQPQLEFNAGNNINENNS